MNYAKSMGSVINRGFSSSMDIIEERQIDLNLINERMLDLLNCNKTVEETEQFKVLKEVVSDLYCSKINALLGIYRTSYIHLRSALELFWGYQFLKESNYHFVLWKKNCFDLSWSELTNSKNGIFKFLEVENIISDNETLKFVENESRRLYRELSEYVHGKHDYM